MRRGPADGDWVELSTIGDLLVRAASRWPDKEAIVFPERRRTYAETLSGAELVARGLLGLGVRPGDRVGVHMANCFDFLDLELGCALIGASVVPLNVRFRAHELSYVLHDSDMVAVATNDLIDRHVDLAEILGEALQAGHPAGLRRLVALGGRTPDGFTGLAEFEALAAAGTSAARASNSARRATACGCVTRRC